MKRFYFTFAIFSLLYGVALGQDVKPTPLPIVGDVTVTGKSPNSFPPYQELRTLTDKPGAFSGEYAQVNNLVLKKDKAIFTLKSGELYFLTPTQEKTTGAVFIGDGEVTLSPPTDAEKKMLVLFNDAPEFKEQFGQLVLMFTDKTFDEVKASPNAKMATGGGQAARARDLFREKETLLKKTFGFNMSSRVLSDILAPQRAGFFNAFIEGKANPKLLFMLDPLGVPEVYPEQVALLNYSENNGGIWTAFHLAEEYEKGTGNSWVDRRVYDIIKHDLDVTIQGTRTIVKDVITMQMRAPNVRFLPFDLYSSLRVKAIRGDDNSELDYVQEKKEEDADLGVILPKPMEPGKPFTITMEYDGLDALKLTGKGNYILNPAARANWYPNNPQADFGDRAKFDITFRSPKKFTMVGVGDRIGAEQAEGDNKISKWSTGDVELAVAGFNYGDFKLTQIKDDNAGYNIEIYTNKELPDEIRVAQVNNDSMMDVGSTGSGGTLGSMNTGGGAKMVMSQTQNAARIYNNFFGKLAYKRIAITEQPAFGFGQAWPTLVYLPYPAFFSATHRAEIMGTQGATDGFWREVTAHEVAHQWWGHMVGWTSYHDQWMSEGFSQFSSSLFIQYVKNDIKAFNEFWEGERKRITEPSPATRGKKPYTIGPVSMGYRLNTPKTGAVAQSLIYPKGGYILHMVRMMMFDHKSGTGDEKFRKMMTDFIASHYNKDVSTDDLKKIMEKHITPEMDVTRDGKMDWFFDQWVHGTSIPEFKLNYQMSNGANGKPVFNGKITQSGVVDGFASVVPLYMDFGSGWKYIGRITIIGNNSLDISNLALPAVPKKVGIDAYKDILNTGVTVTGGK